MLPSALVPTWLDRSVIVLSAFDLCRSHAVVAFSHGRQDAHSGFRLVTVPRALVPLAQNIVGIE